MSKETGGGREGVRVCDGVWENFDGGVGEG